MDYSTDPTNAAAMQLNNASASHSLQYDKERYLQLDFDHAVERGPFTQILTGTKLTNHATGQSSYRCTWT
ncbi:hypothetical protein BRN51_04760 [Xanthomonas oryzae pv. oryzae]|nr:hypothetical protein BRN51_04760 [Xanthomonas oryzae pv. oryzae]QBA12337.1 hypothetical protein DZA53_20775 [Xanthomonas oryzae pv. oryzae]RBF82944.1 hypothetical protein BRM95_17930 [Xanthomonas oryzae pv. oryzae]RBK70947.1 hypothetical protein BRN49_01020 [Xanthomonas oryzae pv. oryzae]UEQ20562.1 hypothetical protein KFK26_04520 [Xanthomonas oryzae]